jgi:tight adherence protein B
VTRLLIAIAVLAAALPAMAGASSADATVTQIARVPFPERGFLVGFPSPRELAPADVNVRENGQPVANLSFVPAAKAAARRAVLLVVDASDSMRGKPIADAFASARDFAHRLGSAEEVGVVTFNSGIVVAQRPTTDASAIGAALANPPQTAEGTRIYDALDSGLDVLRQAHVAAASIVLLSDGADVGSIARRAAVVTRAARMRVRIFTVGLRSPQFRSPSLRILANGTGASFAEASSPAQLRPIYDALAQQLAGEYLLRYRSESNPGTHVVVTVHIRAAGTAVLEYAAPKVVAVAPYKPSPFIRFWASPTSLVLIALLAAALAAGAVVALLRRTTPEIATRISEFTMLPTLREERVEQPKRLFSTLLFGAPERSPSRTRWWSKFKEELEIANIRYSGEQLLGVVVLGTVLAGLVLYLIAPIFLVFAFAIPFVVRGVCRRSLQKVRRAFEDQLPTNLQVLASALRAGHSFVGALSVVAADASEPAKREFMRTVADEQLGVPLEDSLREVARRMANDDLEQVAIVAELQRQSGGNMAEVLDRVVDTVRSRFDLRRMVRTLTAQGRMARWILTFLPLGLAGFISLLNPHYLSPLLRTSGGQIVLAFAASMVIAGSLIIKRIVEIKV